MLQIGFSRLEFWTSSVLYNHNIDLAVFVASHLSIIAGHTTIWDEAGSEAGLSSSVSCDPSSSLLKNQAQAEEGKKKLYIINEKHDARFAHKTEVDACYSEDPYNDTDRDVELDDFAQLEPVSNFLGDEWPTAPAEKTRSAAVVPIVG